MPTRTSTFATNDRIDANALNALAGAWNSYTPTLTQGATLTKTVTRAKYLQFGKLVIVSFNLAITSAGTAGNAVIGGLPVTAATGVALVVGVGSFTDAGTAVYPGALILPSTTTFQMITHATGDPFGVSPAVTAANGDSWSGLLLYEAA